MEAYGVYALGKLECSEWFTKLRSSDFDVKNEELERPKKKFED